MVRDVMSGRNRRISTTLAAAIAAFGAAGTFTRSAHAQVFWDGGAGAADTNWATAANWDLFGSDIAPGQYDPAVLNNGGTVTISSANTGLLVDSFVVGGAADTTIDPANLGLGGTVNFDGGDLTTASAGYPAIDVGQAASNVSVWNHNGGTLNVGNFRAGLDGDATGTLNMHAGQINVAGNFYFGDSGNFTLNIDGGTLAGTGGNAHQWFLGFHPTSSGTVNMSGGTLDTSDGHVLVIATEGNFDTQQGSHVTFNQTGGTFKADTYVLGARTYALGTHNHSGGSLTANHITIAEHGGAVYNLSGDATITANSGIELAQWTERDGFVPDGTLNQSGNSTITTAGFVVGTRGTGRYNLSGGSIHIIGDPMNGQGYLYGESGFRNLIVGLDGFGAGWQGDGTVSVTGGTMTVDHGVYLGSLDDSVGRMKVSGGTVNVAGDFNVASALDSHENIPVSDPYRQASNVTGILTVSGSAASIHIGGNFLANPADKTQTDKLANHSTLAFEINDTSGTSLINVGGVADLDGAVVSMNLLGTSFVPEYNTTFNLLTASSFGGTGTDVTQNTGTGMGFTLDPANGTDWSLQVVDGGNGKMLQAVNLVLPGDTNGDRAVDFTDLLALAKHYNQTADQTRATGDFNRTGSVTFDDLLILAKHYNSSFSTAMASQLAPEVAADFALAQSLVPEPASLGLLGGAGLLFARRRRRQ